MTKPIAFVTGYHDGYPVVQPVDGAAVLPVGMALYAHPAEVHTCSPQDELCPNCGDDELGSGALRNDADELVCGYKYCFNCAHTWDVS